MYIRAIVHIPGGSFGFWESVPIKFYVVYFKKSISKSDLFLIKNPLLHIGAICIMLRKNKNAKVKFWVFKWREVRQNKTKYTR